MSGDFDFEPIRGLPAVPPDGERILWQGAPVRGSLARHAFHVRKVSAYFGVLLAWYAVSSAYDGRTAMDILYDLSVFGLIAITCVFLLAGLGWAYARSSVFTITSERIVFRHGVALPISVNIPFCKIGAISLQKHRDGTGTIAIEPVTGNRIAWLALWPNVRPWHWGNPMPSMRCIKEPNKIADVLTRAIAASQGEAVRMAPVTTEPDENPLAARQPQLSGRTA